MSAPDFQRRILDQIISRYPKKSHAVEHLSDLLDISTDGIYRRINGQTVLSADELVKIARHSGQSLDQIALEDAHHLIFTYNQLPEPITSFEGYLKGVASNLSQFVTQEDMRIYYASHEIPVFLYYAYPRILSFKLFMYGLTVWTFPGLEKKKFHFDLVSQEAHRIASQMANVYAAMSTDELWSVGILESTLGQLEYLAEVERFENPEDAITICEELLELVGHLHQMAEAGKKFPRGGSPGPASGNFNLFYNQFTYTNNIILAILPSRKVMFITIHHPNFLRTTNAAICDWQAAWFERMMKTSISISVHSSRERDRYFNSLRRKVLQTRENLELLLRRSDSW